ncbi:MAG: AI-2E family transporter [Opitutales bacterium]
MFSESQKKIISSAITCLCIVVILFFIVGAFKLFGDFVSHFSTVIYPLVLAGVFSIMLKPIVDFLNDNLKIPRTFGIILIYILLCSIFTLLFIFIVPELVSQTVGFLKSLPEILKSMSEKFFEHFPNLKDVLGSKVTALQEEGLSDDMLKKAISTISATFATLFKATGSIVGFCSILAAFAVVPIYLFYMLEAKGNISKDFDENTKWLNPKHSKDLKFLITQFIGILSEFFRGQMLIAIAMGVLFGIGFSLCGVKFGLLIGLIMGLMNIVPYLGSILGSITVLSVAFFQVDGGLNLVLFALAVIIIVQLIESYYLTPTIMNKKTGLHAGVIMFSIFFWGVALNGIIGMILAIPLSAFIVVFWRLLITKYLSKNSPETIDETSTEIQ